MYVHRQMLVNINMKNFKFRDARTGTSFVVRASSENEAVVKAQSQHDQAEAVKRKIALDNSKPTA